jgi:hypothetical protein
MKADVSGFISSTRQSLEEPFSGIKIVHGAMTILLLIAWL